MMWNILKLYLHEITKFVYLHIENSIAQLHDLNFKMYLYVLCSLAISLLNYYLKLDPNIYLKRKKNKKKKKLHNN